MSRMRDIKKVFVHCADTFSSMDIGVEEIRIWHVKERGWSDIGYHYVIRRNGSVEKGRDDEIMGAGVRGYNADSIHVCLVGGKPDANFTFKQYSALIGLREQLDTKYQNPEWLGHRDAKGVIKTCPSFDVKSFFSTQ